MITSISPIDGRYEGKTNRLQDYFSEYALIKYRVLVEIKYLEHLKENSIGVMANFPDSGLDVLDGILKDFDQTDAQRIKEIERTTNHDVKAVEYFIKEEFDKAEQLEEYKEFIHFGLTSQDINNTALPLMVKEGLAEVIIPALKEVTEGIARHANEYKGIPMLAKTHGQPASPTTLGKEFEVFVERLEDQLELLEKLPIKAKFGGATGNLNAHKETTQIAHYDHLAAILHTLNRINTILIDFCRDIWTYISMEYFKQKVIANEVGSSAMPHKVNPIDFENAEGNLGIANAINSHLAEKLPVSRLQRDLTDSTVIRNVGVPLGHTLIACMSIKKGLSKLLLNKAKLEQDLDANWAVVAEAIQNILRREGYPKPYEALKGLTRGKANIGKDDIYEFVESLEISAAIKEELKAISPFNYVGYY